MEPRGLPPLWALDMAAKAAGYTHWAAVKKMHGNCLSGAYASVVAHARTLTDSPEKYKPVDPYELKRRHDAREVAAWLWERIPEGGNIAADCRNGIDDDDNFVRAAYRMACLKDGTQPIPVEEWSK